VRIIPVLDLKGGLVVRARQGRRDLYKPIVTPLAPSASAGDVARGLLGLHAFPAFYIADLDAIEGRDANRDALSELAELDAPPDLWLDEGIATRDAFEEALQRPNIHAVLGTESQSGTEVLAELRGHPRLILSLDFFADGYRGPREILDKPALWPATVIVMTLARVGGGAGPDLETLRTVKARAGSREIVAAGGIRSEEDLLNLSAIGIEAALVATCLHDGTITAEQLARLGA